MSTATDTTFPVEHEPSHDPDERALFSQLAASMARHRGAVILVWLIVVLAASPLAITLTGALAISHARRHLARPITTPP